MAFISPLRKGRGAKLCKGDLEKQIFIVNFCVELLHYNKIVGVMV